MQAHGELPGMSQTQAPGGAVRFGSKLLNQTTPGDAIPIALATKSPGDWKQTMKTIRDILLTWLLYSSAVSMQMAATRYAVWLDVVSGRELPRLVVPFDLIPEGWPKE